MPFNEQPFANHIADAKEQVRRYEQYLQQTKQTLLYLDTNGILFEYDKTQLKEQETSYAKTLKQSQESLARIEHMIKRERIQSMTQEEKREEYNRMLAEREAKIDYILMYGFDAWQRV